MVWAQGVGRDIVSLGEAVALAEWSIAASPKTGEHSGQLSYLDLGDFWGTNILALQGAAVEFLLRSTSARSLVSRSLAVSIP